MAFTGLILLTINEGIINMSIQINMVPALSARIGVSEKFTGTTDT